MGSRGDELVKICVKQLTSEPDFPAFSEHIQRLMAAIDDEESSIRALTNLILRDYSLTLRLLRTANSTYYNRSGKPILSVTHAVVMLGAKTVRSIAGGLLIFEHFHRRTAHVRELMLLSLLTAGHVREIAMRIRHPQVEEAYLCGMVRNLGELLIASYRPRQYTEILLLMQTDGLSQSAAGQRVLEFTFEDLGQAIVKHWGMPERAVLCQRPFVAPGRGSRAWKSPETQLLAAVSLGHQMTSAVYRQEPSGRKVSLKLHLQDHRALLPLSSEEVREILENSIVNTSDAFATMKIHIDDLRLRSQTQRALESLEDDPPERSPEEDMLARLAGEVRAMVDSASDVDFNSVILMVVEAVYRGGGFDHVLFAFVNREGTRMQGRVGLGDNVDELIAKFNYPLSLRGGPVAPVLLRKTDTVLNAASDPGNELLQHFGVGWLAIYPVVVDGRVVGCLYFESREPRAGLTSRQLLTLEELRNVLASVIQRMRRRLG